MKLQFEENEYYLMKDGEDLAIATTDESFIKELGAERLSRENCEAIKNGYDLEELAEDWCMKPENNWSNNNNEVGDNYGSYKEGFQKAIELLGDKKFSELDKKIDSMVDFAKNHFTTEAYDTIQMFAVNLKVNIQKIQQQTVWDVIVEMENYELSDKYGNSVSCERPKLDENSCLILKRK